MVTDVFAGFFFSSRRRHTRWPRDWSSDVCSSDLQQVVFVDDAHMMSRSVFYDEPVAFGLGDIDLAVWSLDKHVPGPRSEERRVGKECKSWRSCWSSTKNMMMLRKQSLMERYRLRR